MRPEEAAGENRCPNAERGRSRRSRRRSSRAPGCPRSRVRPATALGASVALIDRSSAVLAVAAASSAEEAKLLSGRRRRRDARAAGRRRGRRRAALPRARRRPVADADAHGHDAARRSSSSAPARPSGRATRPRASSCARCSTRKVTDRGDIVARAAELGRRGRRRAPASIVARAAPRAAQTGDWRARVLIVALRALRAASSGAIAELARGRRRAPRSSAIVARRPRRARSSAPRRRSRASSRLAARLSPHRRAQPLGRRSRSTSTAPARRRCSPRTSPRPRALELLAFEDTGSYRLLLPAMSEDPGELERFYEETVAPLAAYDDQYETELVATIEAYLDNDGSVTPTAEQLFTHRHTIRYRLERVKELCGHDITSTEGREKLGLGLKAMRVLGISPPRGPALEPGTEAGRAKVRRKPDETSATRA